MVAPTVRRPLTDVEMAELRDVATDGTIEDLICRVYDLTLGPGWSDGESFRPDSVQIPKRQVDELLTLGLSKGFENLFPWLNVGPGYYEET